METRIRVVVYGNSLHMAGVAASLRADPGFEVLDVDPHSPTARQTLSERHPAAIAFDLSDPFSYPALALLRDQPDLLLVGVDLANDDLLVVTARRRPARSIADLVDILRQEAPQSCLRLV